MSELLEEAVEAWAFVRSENTAQKNLVTEYEYAQWLKFENTTTAKFADIVERYNGTLTSEDANWLEAMLQTIGNAHRMTEQELIDRRAAQELEKRQQQERLRLEQERKQREAKELAATKKSLLSKLGLKK